MEAGGEAGEGGGGYVQGLAREKAVMVGKRKRDKR